MIRWLTHVPIIHVEQIGDERVLNLIKSFDKVEIVREERV